MELLPALPRAALRVVRDGVLVAALEPDGTVTVEGAPYARMEARRVVALDGRTLATLHPDGTVHFEGATRDGRLLDEGSLEAPDGQRMGLREDGHVVFFHPAHPDDPVVLRLRVEGATASARTTATVLVALLMFRARASVSTHATRP